MSAKTFLPRELLGHRPTRLLTRDAISLQRIALPDAAIREYRFSATSWQSRHAL